MSLLVAAGLLVAAAVGDAAAAGAAAPASAMPMDERHRPQFHFSPPSRWMNDPNGMVYWNGEYHLFYQYNPDASVWGPMHWGHAASTDLLHWQHLPVALEPDALGTIFSGSIVADPQNSAGFGASGRTALIALYTSHDEAAKREGRTDFQNQSLAFSLDEGRTFTKYPGNPVLKNPGQRDFRDPKVSWFEPNKTWIMTLVAGDHVEFHSSKDLKHWHHESDFGARWGSHQGVWECPDLLTLDVGDGVQKHVLLVSVNPGGPNGGSATQYFVGDFDGHRFVLDRGWRRRHPRPSAAWVDYGTDDYAGVTWSNAPDARVLFIGWMSNWRYAEKVPTETWRGAMTLPRELTLRRTPRGLELFSMPVPELVRLRAASVEIPRQTIRGSVELTRGFDTGSGLLEVELTLDGAAAKGVTLRFSNAAGEATTFRINRNRRRYELDRSQSGAVGLDAQYGDLQIAPMPRSSSTSLRVFVDRSSLEIFVNGGQTVMTAVEFPQTPYTTLSLETDQAVRLESGALHRLKSIWPAQ